MNPLYTYNVYYTFIKKSLKIHFNSNLFSLNSVNQNPGFANLFLLKWKVESGSHIYINPLVELYIKSFHTKLITHNTQKIDIRHCIKLCVMLFRKHKSQIIHESYHY